MKEIKISVIIPVYNVLEYLRTCLDTLVAQSLQECEFIMVSDEASEEECAICEEYVARDSRFKFFRRKHGGLAAVKNFGMTQARGEYITFVDSDDWIGPDILKGAYELSKKTDSDVTFWNYVITTPQQIIPQRFSTISSCVLSEETMASVKENLFFAKEKKWMIFIYSWCKLYKASLIKDMKFDESLDIGEDRIFSLELFSKKIRVAYLNEDGYFYRQNSVSLTKKYRHDAFDTLMKYVERIKELSNGMYHAEICNEILYKFVESLSLDYFHKDNPHPSKENIKRLKQIFYSDEFRNVVKGCSFHKLNKCHKIDYLFIKFKIFPWLYIRTILFSVKRRLA